MTQDHEHISIEHRYDNSPRKETRKVLEESSRYKNVDFNGDGVISDEEIESVKELQNSESLRRRQMAQRRMAWTAMVSMIAFTILLFSPIIPESRVSALSDLLGLFYLGQAGVVGAYMGMTAWMSQQVPMRR